MPTALPEHASREARLACILADRGFAVFPVPPADEDGKAPHFRPIPERQAYFGLADGGRIPMREAIPPWLYLVYPADHKYAGRVAGGFHQAVSGGWNAWRCYWEHPRFATAPIGLAIPPNILVIDADAVELWPAALLDAVEKACSQIVRTPRNGLERGGHLWFPAPPATAGLHRSGELTIAQENPERKGENLSIGDLKTAAAGFVFAPGSRRGGGMYVQITEGCLELDPHRLAPLPEETWAPLAEMRARSRSREVEKRRREKAEREQKRPAPGKPGQGGPRRAARPAPNPDWRPRAADSSRASWTEAEAAALAAGWKKNGQGLAGPCTVMRIGNDRCFIKAADRAGVLIGCRGCAPPKGQLSNDGVREHLAALVGRPLGRDAPQTRERAAAPRHPARRSATPPAQHRNGGLPDRLWMAGMPADKTPGARYVRLRTGWPRSRELPASIRWISAQRARGEGMLPVLPRGAAGAILYRFAQDGEEETAALQLEAIGVGRQGNGEERGIRRVLFHGRVKRPDAAGSDHARGRRTFRAVECAGRPDAVVLVEGPVDAVAFAALLDEGTFNLPADRTTVLGAPGTTGFRTTAFPAQCGVRVIAADADEAGRGAARPLARKFIRRGLRTRLLYPRAPKGNTAQPTDWADAAADIRGAPRRCATCAGVLDEDGCVVCETEGTTDGG